MHIFNFNPYKNELMKTINKKYIYLYELKMNKKNLSETKIKKHKLTKTKIKIDQKHI